MNIMKQIQDASWHKLEEIDQLQLTVTTSA